MKCAILSIGTELLMGQITDTNAVFLSRELNLIGIDVLYRYTVGDNDKRLHEVLEFALRNCDMVITTGGLGPTEDDMTKETVADFMDDVLVCHEPTRQSLQEISDDRLKRLGGALSENNFRQAMLPSRAVIFDTDKGTAPGFALEKDGKIIICMPGPPREMTRMYERRVKPYLQQFQNSTIYYKTLRIFGRGESRVETDILDLIDAQTDPTIATYASLCECSIRVASKRATMAEAQEAVEEVAAKIRARIGDYIYSEDGLDLPHTVGNKLIERNLSISCAESCTGGMFASQLTNVPGISAVFERGIVTYTERAKMEELGVDPDTLARETAVSPNVARMMADGLAAKTGSDVCVSVTGIAGPAGGTPEQPVGLIYVGCRMNGETAVKELRTGEHDRNWNRNYAVMTMFNMILRGLEGRPMV